jgi:prevent-host-death family protein
VGRSTGPLSGLTSVRPVWEHTFVLSTNRKGAIAEAKLVAAATELGIPVLRPVQEHGRYDLAFEIADKILRVQCKWGGLHDDGAVIKVNLTSSWCTPTGYEYRHYEQGEIDLVAVYCGDLDRCYLLPHELLVGRRAVWLRCKPPKNGQRACLNRAVDFEFPGAVAQLAERLHGMQQARGSSPLSSTSSDSPETLHVGCHQFRNHFGYYLEHAADGHEVLISRRGRPYARLIPVAPRLAAVA